jgi:hypothetical protein
MCAVEQEWGPLETVRDQPPYASHLQSIDVSIFPPIWTTAGMLLTLIQGPSHVLSDPLPASHAMQHRSARMNNRLQVGEYDCIIAYRYATLDDICKALRIVVEVTNVEKVVDVPSQPSMGR